MAEDLFNDQTEEKVDWAKYWAVARRRCWMFVLPFFVGWAVVWSISWLLPSVYRSSTLILVQRQSSQLVVNNPAQEVQSRMDSITQQVYSRTTLVNVATKLGLFAEQRASGKLTDDELVERMRKNIEIEVVQSSDRIPSSFKIYYSSPNPEIAQQVNSELTNSLINGSLENSLADIDRQNKVLDSGLEEARVKLAAQEEKVRQYKDLHMAELPSTLQSNLQILAGKQSQLQNEQEALNQARQRRAYLESALTQYNTVASATKPGETPVGLPALDQELQRLRAQLTDLSARYTDQHPDVRKLKEQISSTQRIRDQLASQLKNKSDNPTDAANDPTSSAPLIEVRSQLKSNELEISNRERGIAALQAEINGYQARLSNTPIREQELADLNRDNEQLKAFYDQLLSKKNQAGMAERIAREQQGDRFTMQDPPSRPSKPDSPNRFRLGVLGLFAGLALGLVVAGGVEFLDDRVYDESVFKQMVPAEVLVEIPALHTPQEELDQKRWQKFSFAGMGLIGIIVVLGTAISFLRG
jgi:succinoglycan biosynthesis transport protein ExoP